MGKPQRAPRGCFTSFLSLVSMSQLNSFVYCIYPRLVFSSPESRSCPPFSYNCATLQIMEAKQTWLQATPPRLPVVCPEQYLSLRPSLPRRFHPTLTTGAVIPSLAPHLAACYQPMLLMIRPRVWATVTGGCRASCR